MIKKIGVVILAFVVLISVIFVLFYKTINVKLNETFVLRMGQVARLEQSGLEIKILKFINSPCPPRMQCIWSGYGVVFEYRLGDKVMSGVNLANAFGYRVNLIESRDNLYVKLTISKDVN